MKVIAMLIEKMMSPFVGDADENDNIIIPHCRQIYSDIKSEMHEHAHVSYLHSLL